MVKKKIVLLIVEGDNDERVLNAIIQNLTHESEKIQFEVVNGDAFIDNHSRSGKSVIKNVIESFIDRTKIPAQRISFVGYLVDVDGIYIDKEDNVLDENKTDDYFQYSLSDKKVVFGCEPKQKDLEKKWGKKRMLIHDVYHDDFSIDIKEHERTKNKANIKVRVYFNNITLEHVLLNRLLRGEEFEEEKRNIVRAFVIALEKKHNVVSAAKDFFNKYIPTEAKSNKEAWLMIEKNPWIRASSISFLIDDFNNQLNSNETDDEQ